MKLSGTDLKLHPETIDAPASWDQERDKAELFARCGIDPACEDPWVGLHRLLEDEHACLVEVLFKTCRYFGAKRCRMVFGDTTQSVTDLALWAGRLVRRDPAHHHYGARLERDLVQCKWIDRERKRILDRCFYTSNQVWYYELCTLIEWTRETTKQLRQTMAYETNDFAEFDDAQCSKSPSSRQAHPKHLRIHPR